MCQKEIPGVTRDMKHSGLHQARPTTRNGLLLRREQGCSGGERKLILASLVVGLTAPGVGQIPPHLIMYHACSADSEPYTFIKSIIIIKRIARNQLGNRPNDHLESMHLGSVGQ